MVPASLKIVKLLVDELLQAAGGQPHLEPGKASDLVDGGDSDDEEWEDDGPNDFLDLGLGSTKERTSSFMLLS